MGIDISTLRLKRLIHNKQLPVFLFYQSFNRDLSRKSESHVWLIPWDSLVSLNIVTVPLAQTNQLICSVVPIEHYSAIFGSLPNNHRSRFHVGPPGDQKWCFKWRNFVQWGRNLAFSETGKNCLRFQLHCLLRVLCFCIFFSYIHTNKVIAVM